jgi:histone H3
MDPLKKKNRVDSRMARTKLTARPSSGSASVKKGHKGGKDKKEAKRKIATAGGIKKPHRFRPGTVADREIRRYQGIRDSNDATKLLIPKAVFARLVKEVASLYKTDVRIQDCAKEALQHGGECLLQNIFRSSQEQAIKGKRKTINLDDFLVGTEMKFPLYPRKQSGYTPPPIIITKESKKAIIEERKERKEKKQKASKVSKPKKAVVTAGSDDDDATGSTIATMDEGTESV